jgi:hypothetical protein
MVPHMLVITFSLHQSSCPTTFMLLISSKQFVATLQEDISVSAASALIDPFVPLKDL